MKKCRFFRPVLAISIKCGIKLADFLSPRIFKSFLVDVVRHKITHFAFLSTLLKWNAKYILNLFRWNFNSVHHGLKPWLAVVPKRRTLFEMMFLNNCAWLNMCRAVLNYEHFEGQWVWLSFNINFYGIKMEHPRPLQVCKNIGIIFAHTGAGVIRVKQFFLLLQSSFIKS